MIKKSSKLKTTTYAEERTQPEHYLHDCPCYIDNSLVFDKLKLLLQVNNMLLYLVNNVNINNIDNNN